MSLVLRIFLRQCVNHQGRDLIAFSRSIFAERTQDFDHVIAVIDAVDQVLLVLTLNLLAQLLNFLRDLSQLFLLRLRLLI